MVHMPNIVDVLKWFMSSTGHLVSGLQDPRLLGSETPSTSEVGSGELDLREYPPSSGDQSGRTNASG